MLLLMSIVTFLSSVLNSSIVKRSGVIVRDVSSPSKSELYADEVKELQPKKDPEPIPSPKQSVLPVSTTQLHDEEMHDLGIILSPKGSMQKHMDKASIALTTPEQKMVEHEVQLAPASPLVLGFANSSSEHHQSRAEFAHKPKYDPVFRNSFGRSKPDLESTPSITLETTEENKYPRRAAKKRELRERKQLTANAALNTLSMGPPIWQFEVETLHEDNIELPNETALSAAGSWLHSKLIPPNNASDNDLLVSSPFAIWTKWVPSQSGVDPTCCLSVIKSTTFKDQNKPITGASAVLFLLSEHIPIEHQKKRLHDLIMLLPAGSRLPLLILSASNKGELAKVLGLDDIDKSRVIIFHITYLKDRDTEKLDGFLSDKHLRKGLEWLASESPPQIVVRGIKTRELVLSHLNSTLEIFDEMDTQTVGPNDCVSAFNEALDRSMKQVADAAHANPTGWPCPEINLLEESSDEYRATAWYLPSIGWSSASKTEVLMRVLNDSKLPALEDDLCWLFNIGHDIENQKLRLENCLIEYLTKTSQMMGVALAQKEAGIVLQKFTRLELQNTSYYIIPKWVSIFRRIFSWRLMNLSRGDVSSTYVLVQHCSEALDNSESKVITFLPPYFTHPSLDELVEVGRCPDPGLESNRMEYEAFRMWSPKASDGVDVRTSNNDVILMENEEKSSQDSIVLKSYDHSATGENDGPLMNATKATKEADRLSELLEKCNIVQNMIDEKLSIYF
ncbi:hypothetical protein DH2020_048953 [Rehmannia glutinosa]|uniref:Uncharacterized protein n=1 Tax=Rehmannia glutinosa TaxID=99300 RepID=A0ABR0U472_REHGL